MYSIISECEQAQSRFLKVANANLINGNRSPFNGWVNKYRRIQFISKRFQTELAIVQGAIDELTGHINDIHADPMSQHYGIAGEMSATSVRTVYQLEDIVARMEQALVRALS